MRKDVLGVNEEKKEEEEETLIENLIRFPDLSHLKLNLTPCGVKIKKACFTRHWSGCGRERDQSRVRG